MRSLSAMISANSTPSENTNRLPKTIGYYAAIISLGFVTASLGPTLPDLARQTMSGLSAISYLFSIRSFGYFCGSIFGSRLYDKFPGHPLLSGMLFSMVILMFLVPLTPSLWLLLLFWLLTGFASATLDVGCNTLIVWVHGRKVGPVMNGLHFFWGMGAFLSPIIIARAMLIDGQLTWAYWSLAVLLLPAAIWILFFPSPMPVVGDDEKKDHQSHKTLVVLVALLFLLYVGAESAFGGWIFTYATKRFSVTDTDGRLLTSIYWGALTTGRLLSIPLALKFKPHILLTANFSGCLLSIICLLLFGNDVLWWATIGFGLSMSSIFPTVLAFAERRLKITGKLTGYFFAGASFGAMILPWLIGQLFESVGPGITMVAILVDMGLAFGIFILLMLHSNRTVRT
ncbi:MFS transporter [candidate division KSB1 bacterium]|nr:MFS transporter [candidate division KSB1 bacterium]